MPGKAGDDPCSSLYAKFQPACFQAEGGDRGDRRWEGQTNGKTEGSDTKIYYIYTKFVGLTLRN